MMAEWIKDADGGLVNMRYVCALSVRWTGVLQDPGYEVVAYLVGGGSARLYTGLRDECERYLADLARRLDVIG